jgi:hypothetical protein
MHSVDLVILELYLNRQFVTTASEVGIYTERWSGMNRNVCTSRSIS